MPAILPADVDRYVIRMTRGYVACALWSELDDEGEPLDRSFDVHDVPAELYAESLAACADFLRATSLRPMLCAPWDKNPEAAGHDFLLTRNGHGAGFWDRGAGVAGDELSHAARAEGPVSLYVGDDGGLYSA